MNQKPEICDPSEKKVQVILTDAFQLGYVLEKLLGFTGAADITVSTFSTGEEFLRKLIALRRKGIIRTVRLFTDFKAAEKTAKINAMLRAAYDEVRFCKNHSKVIIIEGITPPVLVLASQNQTRGNRLENYTIIQSKVTAEYCLATLNSLSTYRLI